VLLLGNDLAGAAKHASSVEHVNKVLTIEDTSLAHTTAETISKLVLPLCESYTHVLAPSSNIAKNFMPRVAALLDCAPLMDILSVESEDTFKRPMYAGNAIATMKMNDKIKV
jgi:electron transfer flavoprotein alpha subunit